MSGYLSQVGFIRSSSLWAIALGGLLLYVPALIWLATIDFGWPAEGKLFVDGMYIYMPGDVTKMLAASLAVTVLWNHGDRIIDAIRRRPGSCSVGPNRRSRSGTAGLIPLS